MAKKKEPVLETSTDVPAAMAALMAVNPVLASAWTDMMSESVRFMTDRLQADLKTQQALMSCKTPAELMQVQAEFLQTAVQQYSDEARRILEMTMKASADVAEDMQSGHKRRYDDIPI